MGSRMLIDAAHAEETRVVVVRGNRIEEFDYESAQRKQLKGNIYLAKVTRVEPSLQAAFVDYGGNRHGFLAFSEIHPDYYQIPVADRQALLREEADEARHSAEEEAAAADSEAAIESAERPSETEALPAPPAAAEDLPETSWDEAPSHPVSEGVEAVEETAEMRSVESVGSEDALEEVPQRRRPMRRAYKIQEVIKRRQVLLVQVVKEERGNKGAALTTYLSLAGRYCVLMPNTARGGGISRKITDSTDRRRLKEVARDIEVPEGMGLIVRTAGAQRTKAEIKRDFDYLIRLWENVRDLTLESVAPSLVYEEGSLIKRSIRDLYTKDVDEVLVEGDDGYREAKDFMKMLMPSHARNVKAYKDTRPLFSRFQMESQLDSLFSPTVTLPSGGYLVINQTEALVSIDINSGKATREHNIEDTALKTNLEAADEIARQLRLRDLAGLIVIDFIDMEEQRNNRSVERRLKEALKNDRARIQVGRISHFGLLEMSRQRLRQGMVEGSTKPCPHCEGRGVVRSVASCALSVLRGIEDYLLSRKPENLTVRCHPDVAVYIFNEKRDNLLVLETTYGISIFIVPSADIRTAESVIERAGERAVSARRLQAVRMDTPLVEQAKSDQAASEEATEEEAAEEEAETADSEARSEGDGADDADERRRRRRRRRGRRGGRRARERGEDEFVAEGDGGELAAEGGGGELAAEGGGGELAAEGGGGELAAEGTDETEAGYAEDEAAAGDGEGEAPDEVPAAAPSASKQPRRRQRGEGRGRQRRRTEVSEPAEVAEAVEAMAAPESPPPEDASAPEEPSAEDEEAPAAAMAPPVRERPIDEISVPAEAEAEEPKRWNPPQQTAVVSGPPKAGWWRR
jgi:ribonuclease E